jgi:hypothetical protein
MTDVTFGMVTDEPGIGVVVHGAIGLYFIGRIALRLVASVSRPEDKQALETLARAWDRIADEREARLLKQIDGDTLNH